MSALRAPRSARIPSPLEVGLSHLSPRLWQRKIHHGGTEITEKGRMARCARQTLILRALRASVVNLYAIALPLEGEGGEGGKPRTLLRNA
jgi:hypothetical protein